MFEEYKTQSMGSYAALQSAVRKIIFRAKSEKSSLRETKRKHENQKNEVVILGEIGYNIGTTFTHAGKSKAEMRAMGYAAGRALCGGAP